MKWSFALFFLILSSVAFGQKIKFKDPKFKEWILKENKIETIGINNANEKGIWKLGSLMPFNPSINATKSINNKEIEWSEANNRALIVPLTFLQ